MVEGNGFVSSGDPRVDAALKRLQDRNDARFKDLEDAVLVQAHLEAAAGCRIKEHAEWLVAHETAMEQHDLKMAEIDNKLNGLIDIVGRMQRRE